MLSSLCGSHPSSATAEQTEAAANLELKGRDLVPSSRTKSIQITLGNMALSISSKSMVRSERENNAALYFTGGLHTGAVSPSVFQWS